MEDFEEFFKMEKHLGRGGFGNVYKVKSRHGNKRRCYALKVIELDNYRVTLDDVEKEFNVMKYLEHRNILSIFNSYKCMDPTGRYVHSFAIQMEYCPHGDLTKFFRDRNGILLKRFKLLQWMEDLTSAVEYIHANDIIHRDLKPDNILLDKNGVLRISDFGIAKIMTQYYATTAIGTKYFVAPEVIHEEKHTKKADIFSLGKVFICIATLERRPGHIDDIPDKYDQQIVDVILNCIRRNPKSRPKASSLLDMVLELQ